jgi:class 3 adenylate cyclase
MRISIALKIFSIALGLLALLAIVATFSTRSIGQVRMEVHAVGAYFAPLAQMAGDIQIKQLRQSLEFERLLNGKLLARIAAKAGADPLERFRQLAKEVDDDIVAGQRLVEGGAASARNEVDRLEFAKLGPMLANIEKEHDDFEDIASKIAGALGDGEELRAATFHEVLDKEERDLNTALEDLRDTVDAFMRTSIADAEEDEKQVFRLNIFVTIGAAISGLLFASLVTTGLMRPIHSLVDGTRAVEHGNLDTEVPVTTGDEIGALTRSFNTMVGELRLKERIKETFGKYVDPRIVANLLEHPDVTAIGERRVVTVFFSDIEGFTTIGESLTPAGLVAVINHYLTVMSEPITRNGGIIDKYIGDAIMAFWAPPFVDEKEHATRACLAALEQLERLAEFYTTLPELVGVRKAVPEFHVRIGLATGDVVIGNIGSENIKGYTVMGDTVNLGSRLEGASKQYGTAILISEQTQAMAASAIESRELDFIRVAGKTEPARVFELMARRGELGAERAALRDRFHEGLVAYRAGEWDLAEQHFRACLAAAPADGPSRVFLDRVARLREAPPSSWDGVWSISK